jgi:kynureninase
MSHDIEQAIGRLGQGPLTEEALREHVFPLFSRVLKRQEIYLANHSLGRPLDQTAMDVQEGLDHWYRDMDAAWGPWMEELNAFRARIARMLGSERGEIVSPRMSAGQGLRAVLNSFVDPVRVIATRGEFDSIDFILKTYMHMGRARVSWIEPGETHRNIPLFRARDVITTINQHAGQLDLLVVSHVFYATGQVLDQLDQVIQAAHGAGAKVLVDCYHAAGVLPWDFEASGADFAIGGSYKYARGGAGACWLAVHPRHLEASERPRLRTLDTGWFAKKDTFKYQRPDEPLLSHGGDSWLESTPAPLIAYQARAGQQFVLALGVHRLRGYSLQQQAFLAEELTSNGVPVIELPERGAYLLVPHEDAASLSERLRSEGVNTDSRLGAVRLCPDVLNTRDELARAARTIARVLGTSG